MKSPKRQAAYDLALKMKLEEPFKRSLKKLFNTIARDIEVTYIDTQRTIDVENYRIDLQAILKDHYRKVSKAFKTNLRGQIKALTDKEIAAAIDAQLTTFINQQTGYQSDVIISTLSKEVSKDLDTIIFDAAADGIGLTDDQIAVQARRKFKKKITGKVNRIGVTETQIIAEKSKYVEAVTLKKHKQIKVKKLWVSTLDEVTRVKHVFVDGQIQELDAPFIAGGQQLMTPGDSSLGASLDNIIECRCNCVYIN